MSLPDPQTITVNAVAQSMPRVETGVGRSVYRKNDSTFSLTISHKPVGKDQVSTLVQFDQRKIATNPISAETDFVTQSVRTIIVRPTYGFTMVELEQQVAGLTAWLTTALVDKLYGGES